MPRRPTRVENVEHIVRCFDVFLLCKLHLDIVSHKLDSHVLFVFVLRFHGPVNPMGSCRG